MVATGPPSSRFMAPSGRRRRPAARWTTDSARAMVKEESSDSLTSKASGRVRRRPPISETFSWISTCSSAVFAAERLQGDRLDPVDRDQRAFDHPHATDVEQGVDRHHDRAGRDRRRPGRDVLLARRPGRRSRRRPAADRHGRGPVYWDSTLRRRSSISSSRGPKPWIAGDERSASILRRRWSMSSRRDPDFLSEGLDLGQNFVFFEHTVQIQSGWAPGGAGELRLTSGEFAFVGLAVGIGLRLSMNIRPCPSRTW